MDGKGFLELLQAQRLLDESDISRALQKQEESALPLGQLLAEEGILEEKRLYDYIYNSMGMNPRLDYSEWLYDIAGLMLHHHKVSGDFFAFFPLDERLMAIVLCDVCGTGPEAGLLAIILGNMLKISIRKGIIIPSSIIRKLNKVGNDFFGSDQFAAFAVVVLDMHCGTLDFCCAGTPPILIYRKEEKLVEELDVSGIPIGIYPDSYFSTGHAHLSRGDIVLIYSNGAFEAQSRKGRFFGLTGIKKTLVDNSHKSARRILKALKRNLKYHSLLHGLNDDTSIIAVKKLGKKK